MTILPLSLLLLLSCAHDTKKWDSSRQPANVELSQNDAKFGVEWTFTSNEIIPTAKSDHPPLSMFKKWAQILKRECQTLECTVKEKYRFRHESAYEIIIKFDRHFQVTIGGDPQVFEVNSTPITKKNLSLYKRKLQHLIFDTAKEIGLNPHERVGGGHLHFDIKTHFKKDPLLIRNFIVDIANNPEIFMGPLGFDPLNAPPISFLSIEQQQIFTQAIRDFDDNKIKISKLVDIINTNVYSSSYINPNDAGAAGSYRLEQPKYQLINLMNYPNTIEIRGFRPQQSMSVQEQLMDIFLARINFLNEHKTPITLELKDLREFISYSYDSATDRHDYKLTYPQEKSTNKFYAFLQESSLDYQQYLSLLPDRTAAECFAVFLK